MGQGTNKKSTNPENAAEGEAVTAVGGELTAPRKSTQTRSLRGLRYGHAKSKGGKITKQEER